MFSKQSKLCYSLPQQNSSVSVCGLKIKFKCLHISFMLFFSLTQNYLSKPISQNILHSTHLGLAHDVLRLSCLCLCCYSNPENPPHKLELIKVLASLVAQRLKHLPPMQETWIWSLGREDPLEKEMAIHSSILAWKIPWMEEPGVHVVAKSQIRLSDFT